MIKIFLKNDPFLLVVSAFIFIVLRLGFYLTGVLPLDDLYESSTDHFNYGPLGDLLYTFERNVFGFNLYLIESTKVIIVLHQATLLNRLTNRNNAYSENNYLVSFLYLIYTCALGDQLVLNPFLVSFTFILLALGKVLRRIGNEVTDDLFLSCGFYLGFAFIIFPPSILYALVFFFGLLFFTSAIPRRLILFIYALVIPVLFVGCGYYWFYQLPLFFDLIKDSFTVANNSLSMVSIIGMGLITMAIVRTLLYQRFTAHQSKIQYLIFLVSIVSSFLIIIGFGKGNQTDVGLAIAYSFFVGHLITLIKKKRAFTMVSFVFILGLIGTSIYEGLVKF